MKALFKTKLKTSDVPNNELEAIQICLPFIHKMAKKWTRNHYSYYQDFVSEGYCGVLEAYKRFKGTEYEEKGYRFSSYAWLWIRVYQRDYAMRMWKFQNSTAQESPTNMDTEYYELDVDSISVKTEVEKLEACDQELLRMKAEGYTFDECAAELGFANLHKARGRYLELCKAVGQ